ncbi:hypothetical protein ACT3TZ_06400 [Brachybacterium sp. AOP25-B2-12]|uniref:hypothetical protein n=1 Tax=Brachybacterium sp. AOP25-B2-12 TaxID=3457710 RepID=UPI0040332826
MSPPLPPMILAVPVVVIVIMLVGCLVQTLRLLRLRRLTTFGSRVLGVVVASEVMEDPDGPRNRRTLSLSTRRETLESTTSSWRVIRGRPASSDIGVVDRTGMTVPVLHDPGSPQVFIAPPVTASASPPDGP